MLYKIGDYYNPSNNRSHDKRFQNLTIQLLLIETHFSEIPNKWKVLKLKELAIT